MDLTSFLQLNKPSDTDYITDDKFWKENPDKIDGQFINHDNRISTVESGLLQKANQSDLNITNQNVSANAASLAQSPKYPVLDSEKISGVSIVVNQAYPYDDVKRYGIVADYIRSDLPYTNNYQAFSNLMTIAQDGQRFNFNENGIYYFEGATGLTITKQLKLVGKHNPQLWVKATDGYGIICSGRYTTLENFTVTGFDQTKGTGVKMSGIAPSNYNAYCHLKNVSVNTFSQGFYLGDIFDIEMYWCIASSCNTGFSLQNVKTTLNMQNCYAKTCATGYDLNSIYYSNLLSCACDSNTTFGYKFTGVRSINMLGCGAESNLNTPMMVDSSKLSIMSYFVEQAQASAGYGSFMTVQNNSVVFIVNGNENSLYTGGSPSTSSIVVDDTSRIRIAGSSLQQKIYTANGEIEGACDIAGVRTYYEKSKQLLYGATPPTTGTYNTGDRMVNTSVSTNNPVAGWECLAGGTPGSWRPYGYLPNKGTAANKPSLSGNPHLGYQYLVTDNNKMAFFDGTVFRYSDGTLV